MQCNKPYYLEQEKMYVPCGRCEACRKARSKEWALRIMHETSYHQYSTFATLTYSDEFLPNDQSLNKKELQRFIKRLRRQIEPSKIKYYACGEYGEKNGRPHYHALIFGLPKNNITPFQKAWKYGLIDLGNVTFQSARYVANYVKKKKYGVAAMYDSKEQPFQIQSTGIGKQFALDNNIQLINNLGCTLQGVPMGLPKYYQKVLEIPTEALYDASQEEHQRLLDYYITKYGADSKEVWEMVQLSRIQSEKNIMAQDAQKEQKL